MFSEESLEDKIAKIMAGNFSLNLAPTTVYQPPPQPVPTLAPPYTPNVKGVELTSYGSNESSPSTLSVPSPESVQSTSTNVQTVSYNNANSSYNNNNEAVNHPKTDLQSNNLKDAPVSTPVLKDAPVSTPVLKDARVSVPQPAATQKNTYEPTKPPPQSEQRNNMTMELAKEQAASEIITQPVAAQNTFEAAKRDLRSNNLNVALPKDAPVSVPRPAVVQKNTYEPAKPLQSEQRNNMTIELAKEKTASEVIAQPVEPAVVQNTVEDAKLPVRVASNDSIKSNQTQPVLFSKSSFHNEIPPPTQQQEQHFSTGQDISTIASTTINLVDEIGYADEIMEEDDVLNPGFEYLDPQQTAPIHDAVSTYREVLSESPLDLQKALLENPDDDEEEEEAFFQPTNMLHPSPSSPRLIQIQLPQDDLLVPPVGQSIPRSPPITVTKKVPFPEISINNVVLSPEETINYERLRENETEAEEEQDKSFTINELAQPTRSHGSIKKPNITKPNVVRNLEKNYNEGPKSPRVPHNVASTKQAKPISNIVKPTVKSTVSNNNTNANTATTTVVKNMDELVVPNTINNSRNNSRNPSPLSVASNTGLERPITVAVRVRPFNAHEKAQSCKRTISVIGDDLIVVNPNSFDAEPDSVAAAAVAIDNSQWAHSFQFEKCLWSYDETTGSTNYVNQVEVHDAIGLDIVEHALSGISCSCFAYGNSNTGKTYSLFGNVPSAATKPATLKKKEVGFYGLNSNSGLVPRVFHDIVTAIKTNCISTSGSRIFISFLEIYNEKIVDLLADSNININTTRGSMNSSFLGTPSAVTSSSVDILKVREHPNLGPYVENLRRVEVFSAEDALQLIMKGQANRKVASTQQNSESSRSHAVVTLELAAFDLNTDGNRMLESSTTKRSVSTSRLGRSESTTPKRSNDQSKITDNAYNTVKIQMVDLMSNDHTEDGNGESNSVRHPEHQNKEQNGIRKSLATLGQIIQSLSKGAALKSLPYRDSILTFLLRDALNGQNYTTMLTTIAPSDLYYEETLATLRYAEKLCSIRRKKSSTIGMITNGVVPRAITSSPNRTLNETTNTTGLTLRDHRPQLIEEFRKFHHDLGSAKKGSLASRQLLQFTVSDPQQRVAKLTRGTPLDNNSTPHKTPTHSSDACFTSPIDGTIKRFKDLTLDDISHLQSSYRNLQGQVIELQIDIDALRTDRDTLLLELHNAKDQLISIDSERKESNTRISNLLKSLKQTEKEVHELRLLNKRQEEENERMSYELQEQRQGRITAEQQYHARTKEFLTRFEQVKKENKAFQATIELNQNRDTVYNNDKIDLLTQNNKLKSELENLSQTIDYTEKEKQYLKDQNMLLQQKMNNYEEITAFNTSIQQDLQTIHNQYQRKQEDYELLKNEYESLLGMIEQKDSLLWLQNQQTEYSKKLLQQQKHKLERKEMYQIELEDWIALQENLKLLFQSEKTLLLSELMDTNHLVKLIKELKLRLSNYQQMEKDYEINQIQTKQLESKIIECFELMKGNDHEKNTLQQEITQLQSQIMELQSLYFLNSHYSRTNSNSNGNGNGGMNGSNGNGIVYPPNVSIQQKLFLENEQLILQNKQLLHKVDNIKEEMEKHNKELMKKEENMQREYQSLGKSLQELEKFDKLKDQSIQELLMEKKQLYENNTILSRQIEGLQQELQEIDVELERAASMNNNNMNSMNMTPRQQLLRQAQQPMMMRTPLPMNNMNMNNMNMTMPPPPPQQQQQPQQQTSYSSTPSNSNHPINGAAIFQSYSAANKAMPSPFQPPSYSNNNNNSNRSFTSTTPLPPNRGDRDYSFFNTSYDSQLNESEQAISHQIEELSGLLDDNDRMKRMRLRTNSGSGSGGGNNNNNNNPSYYNNFSASGSGSRGPSPVRGGVEPRSRMMFGSTQRY